MSNFIKSTNVKMFPSGFRGVGYSESKLTTEQNLTRLKMLSSYKDLNKYVCEDPDDPTKIIIYLGGYYFNVDKSAVVELTQNEADKSIFAYIKLRDIAGVGKVLANLGGSLPEVLDTSDSAETSVFEGLRFCQNKDTKDNKEGYGAGDFYIQVLNSDGKVATNVLKLSANEISDNTKTNDTPISSQFTTDKIITKNITSNSITPLVIDNTIKAGEKSVELNGNISVKNDVTISANTTISGETSISGITTISAPLSVNSSLTTNEDMLEVNGKTMYLSGNIHLPSDNSDEVDKALTQRSSTNTWMGISEQAKPSTLVRRGNDGSITSSIFKGNMVGDLTGKVNDVVIKKETESSVESIKILPKDENPEYGVKVTGKLEINKDGSLLAGKPNSESNINISNNFISNQNVKIDEKGISYNDYVIKPTGNYVLPNDGDIDETNDTALVKSAGSTTKKWVKISSVANTPNAIVMTDDKGNINVQATGTIDKATEASMISKIQSYSSASLPILLGNNNENSTATPLFANANKISITPSTGTFKANKIIATDSEATNIAINSLKINNEALKDTAIKIDKNGNLTANSLETNVITHENIEVISEIKQDKYGKITGKTKQIQIAGANLGLVKSATTGTTPGKDYDVEVKGDGTMKVNVPWENTTYEKATNMTLGLVRTGYEENAKNYPVKLDDNGRMFTSIPWTDTGVKSIEAKVTTDSTITGSNYQHGLLDLTVVNNNSDGNISTTLNIHEGYIITPNDIAKNAYPGVVRANSTTKDYYASDLKEYGVNVTSDGTAFVQVPWENTTYENATRDAAGLIRADNGRSFDSNHTRNYGLHIDPSTGAGFVDIPWESYQVYASSNQGGLFLQKNDGTNVTPLGTISLRDLGTDGAPTFASVTATIFQTSSDLRLKENIRDFEYEKSILDLPVKRFDYKNSDNKNNIGCIAQDLQKLYPELVVENKDGYLSVEETKLVYLLIEEMKLMKKEINELKKKVG